MVLFGTKFQVSLSNVVLIGTKCLVFPQQRGFDWYEAKFYVLPATRFQLIDACLFKEIGLITVLTSRQTALKTQRLYGNPMSNNFDKTSLLKNS